ncbi:hypothetical protein D3C76_880130 [compost metagenome]
MTLYPLAAAIIANPIPVFPLVGSIIVPPGDNSPLLSAVSIRLYAARSFTLPEGFNISSFTYTSAAPSGTVRFNRTMGVCPISSVMLCTILIVIDLSFSCVHTNPVLRSGYHRATPFTRGCRHYQPRATQAERAMPSFFKAYIHPMLAILRITLGYPS